eukprot:767579-Hanusia_phi.AAC.10
MPRHNPILLLLHGVHVQRHQRVTARGISVQLMPSYAAVLEGLHVELQDFLPSSQGERLLRGPDLLGRALSVGQVLHEEAAFHGVELDREMLLVSGP